MNRMQHRQPAVIDRRRLFGSIAGLAASLLLGRMPFWKSEVPVGDEDFVIINGWVLTRADVAASDLAPNVV